MKNKYQQTKNRGWIVLPNYNRESIFLNLSTQLLDWQCIKKIEIVFVFFVWVRPLHHHHHHHTRLFRFTKQIFYSWCLEDDDVILGCLQTIKQTRATGVQMHYYYFLYKDLNLYFFLLNVEFEDTLYSTLFKPNLNLWSKMK